MKKKDMRRKIIFLLLLLGIVIKILIYILSHNNYFVRRFDPQFFGKLYSESQYVKGQLSEGGIGDDGLYAFAGYYYLFQGGDITSVNFEHPPLGKYLIGLSILLFNNENLINLIYFTLLLLLSYKLGRLILHDQLFSILAVLIISADPLILDHLLRSLLDLPFTLFFTAAVYFFLLSIKRVNYIFISQLFWGMAFSTRFFPSLVIIYAFLFLLQFFYHKKSLLLFCYSSLLIPLVYLVSHTSFFFYHPSIIEFLRHKKWMLSWFAGSTVVIGNIWQNIFIGQYIDSTGKIQINQYWTPILPISLTLAITRIRKNLIRKDKIYIMVIYGISMLYLLYLTFLTGGLQKFFMPIYPLIVILALSNISCIIETCKRQIIEKSKGK